MSQVARIDCRAAGRVRNAGERIEVDLPKRVVTDLEELAARNYMDLEQLTAMLVQGALGLVLDRGMRGLGCRRCGLRLHGITRSVLCLFCRLEMAGRRVPYSRAPSVLKAVG
jgi:hypothetical protein